MNNKLSIIIPVYNCEDYIRRCLDSIINQSYKDFEIILVNDGSIDKSLKIIKEYEKKYSFIQVYNQKNSGPAIARNTGLSKAKTDYIMFIDSDDFIDREYINKYMNYANGNYDVVIGGYKKVSDKKVIFTRKLKKSGEFSKYIVTGPYCHLYKKDFLDKHNIFLQDTLMSEDIMFNIEIFSHNPKIKIIDDISYNYYTNLNSISNTSHKGFNEKIDFLGFVSDLYKKESENKKLHEYFIIRYIIWYLLYSGRNVEPNKFYNYYMKCFKWLKNNIIDYEKNKYIRLTGPKGEISKIGITIWLFIKLHKFHLIKLFSKVYCRGKK